MVVWCVVQISYCGAIILWAGKLYGGVGLKGLSSQLSLLVCSMSQCLRHPTTSSAKYIPPNIFYKSFANHCNCQCLSQLSLVNTSVSNPVSKHEISFLRSWPIPLFCIGLQNWTATSTIAFFYRLWNVFLQVNISLFCWLPGFGNAKKCSH